ncbi:M20 family peptidase [Amphritea sp. HPY]|uniref:M20 family peptidase n=1 Tax=Amphritea sp. HPY TaxID=3421652 RepID=UPI003D7DB7EE
MKLMAAVITGIILIFLGVILFRTSLISNRQIIVEPVVPTTLIVDQAARRLAEAIRYKTISYQDPSQRNGAEFLKLHQYLEKAFPRAHTTLSKEVVNNFSLLYTWKGSSKTLKPIVLIAHMDVVPSVSGKEGDWTYPPFDGHIADGYIWGRGSLDVKLAITASLEAVEILIKQGFQPQRTVYLAFGHDEETGGQNGAAKIANLLQERGVLAEFTLDEGSAIVKDVVPGVAKPVALIALAEKGYLTLELTAIGEGGHSSRPKHPTAIEKLARAIYRLESNRMPAELRQPAAGIFEYLASEMSIGMRVVVANRWLFEPLLLSQLEGSPATNAIIRTTTTPTMLPETGTKENVIPEQARAIINFRILPGDTIQGVLDHVKQTVSGLDITINKLGHSVEASSVSDHESSEFQALHKTIRQVFPDTVVAPSLVIGGTDSKHYEKIAEQSFRFIPMRLEKQDLKRIHGKDERISIVNYGEIIRFYVQLLRNTAGE